MNSYPQAQDGGNKFVEGLATGGLLAGLGYFSLNPQRRAEARQKIANMIRPDAKSATAGVRQGDLGEKVKVNEQNLGKVQAAEVKPTPTPAPIDEYVPRGRAEPTDRDLYPSQYAYPAVSPEVHEARRKQATADFLQRRLERSTPYQAGIPGINAELIALRSKEFGDQTGVLQPEAPSRPLSAAPDQLSIDLSSPRGYLESQNFVPANTMVDQQDARVGLQVDQSVAAINAAEDQATGRVMRRLQANEDLDIGAVNAAKEQAEAVLEDTISRNPELASNTPLDAAANSVARSLPDGAPIDQAETGARMQGPITAQEQADLAVAEMKARRQELEASGLQPGTVRFERRLAEPFRTSEYTQMRGTGEVETALPAGPIRQTVESVGASEPLIERSLTNVGPDAQITSTAAGTAIRGKSPSYQNAPAKEERRQLFGTSDASVTGAPDELGQDIPGSARVRGIAPQLEEGEGLSKQEIIYSALDRPATPELPGGSPGIGIYGEQSGYVAGPYSAAASRKPTYVPAFLQKRDAKTGFESLSTEQLTSGAAKAEGRVKDAFESELNRRENAAASLQASEILRRARIEGRNPQSSLGERARRQSIPRVEALRQEAGRRKETGEKLMSRTEAMEFLRNYPK